MKIAIPVKMNKDNPPIAPLFGKAKWFALIENGNVTIQENPADGGREVIQWLDQMKVDTIIMQEMGQGPYSMIKKLDTMKVYHSGFERILLNDVLENFLNNELIELNEEGMSSIIAHHELKHAHHDNNHQHSHH